MSTYEYEDEEKARAWFDATTPDREAFRAFDAIRHEAARRVGGLVGEERQAQADELMDELNAATDRMEQAARHVSELLANFDLELIGLGAGVACLPRGLKRRLSPELRAHGRRHGLSEAQVQDELTWTYADYCNINLDAKAWCVVYPLLVELVELRARVATEGEQAAQILAERGAQEGALPEWIAEPENFWFHRVVDEGVHLHVRRVWIQDCWRWMTGLPGSTLFPESPCSGPRQGMRRMEQQAAQLIQTRNVAENASISDADLMYFCTLPIPEVSDELPR